MRYFIAYLTVTIGFGLVAAEGAERSLAEDLQRLEQAKQAQLELVLSQSH